MTATPSTASQAPAVSIDDEEFSHMLAQVAILWMADQLRYALAREKLVAHIDAKLAQAREAGFEEGLKAPDSAYLQIVDRAKKAEERATAAEAKLEAIRQDIEGIERYEHWDAWGASGTSKAADGDYVKRDDVIALLQPQPQANESGLPG